MTNGLIPFPKPALSLDDQLKLLISRGLKVQDRSRAYHYLRYIGYYRLSGYFRPLEYPLIDKRRMGFPKGWTSDPFWGLS